MPEQRLRKALEAIVALSENSAADGSDFALGRAAGHGDAAAIAKAALAIAKPPTDPEAAARELARLRVDRDHGDGVFAVHEESVRRNPDSPSGASVARDVARARQDIDDVLRVLGSAPPSR